MSVLFYNLFLLLYQTAIRLAAPFNPKARKWVEGRRDLFHKVRTRLPHNEKRIWMHCASVGEFEQGRPLIEEIKHRFPGYKLLLTFFSPSGYELRKDYELADYVFYLPMDGPVNAPRFIRLIQPSLAIFIKYEFWYYYITTLKQQAVPAILVSGAFRPDQPFFKWYGGLFRKMLRDFSCLFVQDEASAALVERIGVTNSIVTGDTRYDRVAKIAAAAASFPEIERWQGSAKLLVAGSTWPADEQLLAEATETLPEDWKLVIAPHEIDESHLEAIRKLFGDEVVFYSALNAGADARGRVLVIDNIGMLSSLYRYGSIAYIGGGFQTGGIHNTLEPAVFGLPVIFGPEYEKFVEARKLVAEGLAYPVTVPEDCRSTLRKLADDSGLLESKRADLKAFVQNHMGATGKIMQYLAGKFL